MKLPTQMIFRGQVDQNTRSILQFMWEEIARVVNFNLDVALIVDHTHAERLLNYLPADFPLGTGFFESDRRLFYVNQTVSGANAWVYVAGLMITTVAAQPIDLGVNDAGVQIWLPLQNHHFSWSGTAWQFDDEEGGHFSERVSAPTGAGWQLCDGTATDYLQLVAGVIIATAFTTPDEVTAPSGVYHKSIAAYTGAINAPVAPLITGSTASTTATNIAAATGISIVDHPSHTHADASSNASPDLFAPDTTATGVAGQSGGPSAVLSHPVTDPTHNHTQNSHLHAVGTLVVGTTGEPRNMGVLRYFRR